jgi:uncharacterized membrane protein YdbT with pleckstrin-like domain
MSEQEHDTPERSTEPSTTAPSTEPAAGESRSRSVLKSTTPTIQPTILKIVALALIGFSALGVLTVAPSLVVGPELASVARVGVGILLVLGLVRYFVHIIVLRRTTYTVHSDGICREFQLLFRTKTREVPYEKIRSQEFEQSRFQALLGFGSIALNQGLGSLILTDVPNPEEMYEQIRAQVADE